jgi:LVIVD repeat
MRANRSEEPGARGRNVRVMGRTRRISLFLVVLVGVLPAVSSASVPGPVATGFASDNVEHVDTLPIDAGLPTGARLVGKYLYVGGSKTLSIYDVSDPIAPELMSITPLGFQFPNEDIDTNGRILLMSDQEVRQQMHIWDVRDKAKPKEIKVIEGLRDHTFSCVMDCRWGYGAHGTIVDLRKPAQAKVVGNWGPVLPGQGFDVTEVAPGRVLTASRIMNFFDARRTPTRPRLKAWATTRDNRILHSVRWPLRGTARFLLVQGETPFSGRCNESSGAFMTWDTKRWQRTKQFRLVDEFRVQNGMMADGNPPANAFGCTTMWFDDHPKYARTGLVASAFFEHGTRFLHIDEKGKIGQVGHFTPIGGSTIASYWITDKIVYAIDVQRGIDILRFNG